MFVFALWVWKKLISFSSYPSCPSYVLYFLSFPHPIPSPKSSKLAVSRAVGDVEFKVPSPIIGSTPEINSYKLTPEFSFLILACDGVWDVLSDQEAVDIVLKGHAMAIETNGVAHDEERKVLHSPHFTPADAAGAIIRAAFKKMSMDNISVIVVRLAWK
eukprot:m.25876 g.25876  ORF g.25876 m.25876 type:complete len:159 (+) comp5807_c1_seq1:805-1281(+)